MLKMLITLNCCGLSSDPDSYLVIYCCPSYGAPIMKKLSSSILTSCDKFLREYRDAGVFITGDFSSLQTNLFNRHSNFSQLVKEPTRKQYFG